MRSMIMGKCKGECKSSPLISALASSMASASASVSASAPMIKRTRKFDCERKWNCAYDKARALLQYHTKVINKDYHTKDNQQGYQQGYRIRYKNIIEKSGAVVRGGQGVGNVPITNPSYPHPHVNFRNLCRIWINSGLLLCNGLKADEMVFSHLRL